MNPIVRLLKSTGKGVCILSHGVVFRGKAEADIRRALVRKGYIKGIIGLPANLFYGTSLPACIIVLPRQKRNLVVTQAGGKKKAQNAVPIEYVLCFSSLSLSSKA